MGRLIFLLLALILAFYTQSLMAGAEIFAPFVLRDGLILSALAIFIFGLGCRYAEPNPFDAGSDREHLPFRSTVGWIAILLVLGVLVRYWAMDALPAQCIGSECTALMRLADPDAVEVGAQDSPPILSAITDAISTFVDTPIAAIRWTGVIVGSLTLLAFFLFARQATRPSAALMATMLLVQLPWHVWASASSDSRITLPLFICSAGWLLLCALRGGDSWLTRLPWLGGAIVMLIGLWIDWPQSSANGMTVSAGAGILNDSGWQGLAENLFYQGDFGAAGALFDGPLLGWLVGGLAIVGIAALFSPLSRRASSAGGPHSERSLDKDPKPLLHLILLLSVIVSLLAVWMSQANGSVDLLTDSPASRLLVLLPSLLLLAALALDRLIDTVSAGWARLVDGRRLAFAALIAALLWPMLTIGGIVDDLSAIAVRGEDPLDPMLIEYLSEELPSTVGAPVTYLVPADFLADPTTAIQIGPAFDEAVEAGQLRPFNPAEDLLFVGNAFNGQSIDPATELIYLLDGNDSSMVGLITQLFPDGSLEAMRSAEPESLTQLIVFRVAAQSILDSQGLQQAFFPGNDPAAVARQPLLEIERAPLAADWGQLPVNGPFSSEWSGTLLIPASGSYLFQSENHPGARLQLMLDNVNVLDTGSGMSFGELELARGPYRITVRYQSEPLAAGDSPASFNLTWQPPDQSPDAIPVTLLQNKLPPNAGLLGYYYDGERFEAPELAFQKDLLVGMEANLPKPHSILWRGKLAASRSGEYQLGVLTAGRAAVRVDGQMIVDAMLPPSDSAADEPSANPDGEGSGLIEEDNRSYVEGRIYLQRGWRDVEVAYIPAEGGTADADGLELFWVPPGSFPATLPMDALAPYLGGLSLIEYPLPAAPELLAPYLGDQQFALSLPQAEAFSRLSFLPENLPPISTELIWQTQTGCGSGPDQFLDLHGVAIDAETGQVYIADTGNQRVVSFDFEGFPARSFTSENFEEPFEVAMQLQSETGETLPLVLDAVNQQIFRLDPNESSSAAVTQINLGTSFYRPRGFDVDENGNIAVADTGGARVVLLTPDGNVLFEAGGRESALGLGQPVDAISIGGQLWALTAEDGRLWQLTGNANESGSVGAIMATDTLNGPRLAGVRNGGIFVADPVRGTVTYHAPNGQPFLRWRDPSITSPVGIDLALVDEALYMALADRNNCSVSLWQLDRAVFGL